MTWRTITFLEKQQGFSCIPAICCPHPSTRRRCTVLLSLKGGDVQCLISPTVSLITYLWVWNLTCLSGEGTGMTPVDSAAISGKPYPGRGKGGQSWQKEKEIMLPLYASVVQGLANAGMTVLMT